VRALYAALAIVAGYTSLGHREAEVAVAARATIDASAVASISIPASLPINNVNRTAKADMTVAPRPVMTAGFADVGSFFAPAKDDAAEVRTAFLTADTAVAVRTDAFALAAVAAKPTNALVTAAISAPPVVKPVVPAALVAAVIVPRPVLRPVTASATASAANALLAYAGTEATDAIEKPFAAVMGDKVQGALLDPNIDDAHAWVNNPIPTNARAASEVKCLATAIYFEARGEAEKGQIAVAQVVLNRLKNPAYPKTVCDVVYQNKNKRNRCQFSFACDGIPDRINDKSAWDSSMVLARRVLNDKRNLYIADVGASTHYHATYVKPRWARSMKRMDKIGRHVFYKTKNGGWS
jgi:spore germination cell wall hydrolase CwlJ-like protein